MNIVPAIIAKNQRELSERFSKVSEISKRFHLDVMDGRFVKARSLMFDFTLKKNSKYRAHLMMRNPEKWIKKNYARFDAIIVHAEAVNNIDSTLALIKSKKKRAGLAINPGTPIAKVKNNLRNADLVIVMSVHPGKYGAKFLPDTMKKVKEIKKINRGMMVGVDGGMNEFTIRKAKEAGADFVVMGSYLQRAKNAKKALNLLKYNS